MPQICSNLLPTPKINSEKYSFIQNKLAENIVVPNQLLSGINLLIGQDNYWLFNSNKVERITDRITAVDTYFGWTIQGGKRSANMNNHIFSVIQCNTDDFDLSTFWKLESIGISNNDEKAISNTVATIKKINNRYSVNLPWKLDKLNLDSNRRNAESRLKGLTAKLLSNQDKLEEYHNEIEKLVQAGIAEQVDSASNETISYYMPHRPIYREDKATTKMRIVFDASSSEAEYGSLNEFLSPGENLLPDLLSVLLRFRSKKIAITADIEKAFLQISLDEIDRDTHRFLWYDELPNLNKKQPNIIEMRMTRVTFGVTSSPFLLSAVIRKHLSENKEKFDNTCSILLNSFYVDDLLISCFTIEEAEKLFYEAKQLMSEAQFNLRKWNSNSLDLRTCFSKEKIMNKLQYKKF